MTSDADAEMARSYAGAPTNEADLKKARISGEQAGAVLDHEGGENPYGHDVFDLRTAWFDGFSTGRAKAGDERSQHC